MEKTAKQIAQALAHRKWRASEKGKAYYLRKKLRDNGAEESEKRAELADEQQRANSEEALLNR